jgi:hypothetical protein
MAMSDREEPSFAALIATLFAAADGLIIGGTVCPGLLMCVPGILLVLVPMLALGLVVLVLVAVPIAVGLSLVMAGRLVGRLAHRALPATRPRHQRVAAPAASTDRLVVLMPGSPDHHA